MEKLPKITLSAELNGKIQLGVLFASAIDNSGQNPSFENDFSALVRAFEENFRNKSITEFLDAVDVRRMYSSIGLDPTKTRPSSEALFRRISSGKGLYRVNTLVDLGNLSSIEAMLPLGLYDLQNITGNIEFRLGRQGEGFDGINKGFINVESRYCLADDRGPFGNPSSDSYKTRITEDTKDILWVFFVPPGIMTLRIEKYLDSVAKRIETYLGGKITSREIIRVPVKINL